jgi:hypothetical protein
MVVDITYPVVGREPEHVFLVLDEGLEIIIAVRLAAMICVLLQLEDLLVGGSGILSNVCMTLVCIGTSSVHHADAGPLQ